MNAVVIAVSSVAGALLAAPLACVPALHIYNVMGLLLLLLHHLAGHGVLLPPEATVPFAVGLLVGYAVLNTLPSVLLAAPDESAVFTVLPGQKYLMLGRGYEAVMITTLGALMGLLALVVIFGPLAPRVLPAVNAVLRPHLHWMLWCVIAFMLMSEWPKGGRFGPAGWAKFLDSWKTTGAGLLTFLLSGVLGFILMYRSPMQAEVAFQSLMPAFVGVFAVPWLLLNIVSGVEAPPQTRALGAPVSVGALLQGGFAGTIGGGFAAFVPAVTGGVGGMLAGHATALRQDRVFLISQGASKVVYYVGSVLVSFVPGIARTRGGAAWMLRGLHEPGSYRDYGMVLGATALAGAVALLLADPLTRGMIRLMQWCGYRLLSWATLAVMALLVLGLGGWAGLLIAAAATGIGLIPVLYGSRRMNCLGLILLPIACNMSGVGPTVAQWLGLI